MSRSNSASPSVPPSPTAISRNTLPRSFNSSQLRQSYAPSRLSSSSSAVSAEASPAFNTNNLSNNALYHNADLSHPPSPLSQSHSWFGLGEKVGVSAASSTSASPLPAPAPSIEPSPSSSVPARDRNRLVRHSSSLSSAPHTANPSPYQPTIPTYPISITSSSRPPTPSRRSSHQPPTSSHYPLFPSRHTRENSVSTSIGMSSRSPSQIGRHRHPSTVSFKSFVEGVSHVTRVRSPVLRGHSRCPSRDDLAAAASENATPSTLTESRPWDWDWQGQANGEFLPPQPDDFLRPGPRRPTASRSSSFASTATRSRLGSVTQSTPPSASRPSSVVPSPRDGAFGRKLLDKDDLIRGRSGRKLSERVTFESGSDTEDELLPDEEGDGPHSKLPNRWQEEEVDEVYARKYSGLVEEEDEDHLDAGDLGVFDEGDVVAVGQLHRGLVISDCFAEQPQSLDAESKRAEKLEIVRQLGHGSYAVVYLVREILYDGYESSTEVGWNDEDDGDLFSVGDDARTANSRNRREGRRMYGEEFALKCLCKRNLSDDLLEVQRFEATLHQSLPDHPNIVALHRAYETSEWLFLVLEYCPGQDLFFWLEQARDHEDLEASAVFGLRASTASASANLSRTASALDPADATVTYRWPPPPMSPERDPATLEYGDNTPPSPSLLASTANDSLLSRRRLKLISRMFAQMCEAVQACHDVGISHRDIKPENFIVMDERGRFGEGEKRVVVKITDWGLGTSEDQCEDWECGSRPYMAFECRNNLRPTYDPRQADVWSLGIVLINLLYHRCPWSDPSYSDPDYAAFCEAPAAFLKDRFEGIGTRVSTFLTERVFCDVVDGKRQRISAGDFGIWAKRLVRILGEGDRRASVSESTIPMTPSSHRPSPGEPRLSQIMKADRPSPRSSTMSYSQHFTASPSPLPRTSQLPQADELPNGHVDSPLRPFPPREVSESPRILGMATEAIPMEADEDPRPPSPTAPSTPSKLTVNTDIARRRERRERADCDEEGDEVNAEGEIDSAARVRRRKRGARKGKSHRHTRNAGTGTGPGSLEDAPEAASKSHARHSQTDVHLNEIAEAAQNIARELSKTKPAPVAPSAPVSSSTMETRPSAAARSASAKPSFMDRMKTAFKDGNPDLNAFAEQVRARDAALGIDGQTASAPAKLQQRSAASSAISASSFGTNSAGSWRADDDRGRHWASASSRRERLDRRRTPKNSAEHSMPPPSRVGSRAATSTGASSPSPLSSFSSTSAESPATVYSSNGSAGPWTPKSVAARSAISVQQTAASPLFETEAEATPRPLKPGFATMSERERSRTRPIGKNAGTRQSGRSVYAKKDAGTSTTSLEGRDHAFVVLASPTSSEQSSKTINQPLSGRPLRPSETSNAQATPRPQTASTIKPPPSRDGSVADGTGGRKKLSRMFESLKNFRKEKDADSEETA